MTTADDSVLQRQRDGGEDFSGAELCGGIGRAKLRHRLIFPLVVWDNIVFVDFKQSCLKQYCGSSDIWSDKSLKGTLKYRIGARPYLPHCRLYPAPVGGSYFMLTSSSILNYEPPTGAE